ncbi:MAG: hypothetical protein FD169_362 [Bacillota bacterium]|nr:MAG: hypothetical protein FD169_362 [Bacillota bacterium]
MGLYTELMEFLKNNEKHVSRLVKVVNETLKAMRLEVAQPVDQV